VAVKKLRKCRYCAAGNVAKADGLGALYSAIAAL